MDSQNEQVMGQEQYHVSSNRERTNDTTQYLNGLATVNLNYPVPIGNVGQMAGFEVNEHSQVPFQTDLPNLSQNWSPNIISTINWLQMDDMTFNDEDFNTNFPLMGGDFAFSPDLGFYGMSSQQDNPMTTTESHDISNPGLHRNSTTPANFVAVVQNQTPSLVSPTASDQPTVASGEYYVDGEMGRLPRSKTRKIVSGHEGTTDVSRLSFDLDYRFSILPCSEATFRLSTSTYDAIHKLYRRLCLDKILFKPFLAHDFPRQDALEGLLASYFTNVDPVVPFIHISSFSPDERHVSLILAMMALGSAFVEGSGSEVFVLSMHEFIRRVLKFSDEDQIESPKHTLHLIQARLLHAMGAGCTLHPNLRTSALQSLSASALYCRDQWRRSVNNHNAASIRRDPLSRWMSFAEIEESTRTGYCIWLLDCMYSFQCQQKLHLDLECAAGLSLPCSEQIWAARTATDWDQMSSILPKAPTFLDAIRNLYVEKRLLPNLGEFSRILLIHGLFHRTWEVENSLSQPLAQLEPSAQKQASQDVELNRAIWAPSVPLFNKWRNSACDCIDILHWSANAAVGTARGIEHPTVLHLHLSRVVLLAPLRDIIMFSHSLVRSGTELTQLYPPVAPSEAEEHKRRIKRWAIQDQYKARLGAIHAGVLFWHIRRFSVNAFYEPTAVALAALFLWAFAAFSVEHPSSSSSGTTTTATTNPHENPIPRSNLSRHSNNNPSPDVCDIILLDRPTDDELVQQFVRQGHLMHANMTGVGDLFAPPGPQRVLFEAQKLLRTLGAWKGITSYWLKVLNRLETVTARAGVDSNTADGAENA